jgi:P4 family phage/plasmid primase-like protien
MGNTNKIIDMEELKIKKSYIEKIQKESINFHQDEKITWLLNNFNSKTNKIIDMEELKIKKSYIEKIQKESINFHQDEKITWLLNNFNSKTNKIETKVIYPELAIYLRKRKDYLFVREKTTDEPQKFIWNGTYYKAYCTNDFLGYIKRFIPENLHNFRGIKEVYNLLMTNNDYISNDQLNPEKYINFKNGLLNLNTMQLEKHDKSIFSTIQINCNYNPNIRIKNSYFDRYMNDICSGNENTKLLLKQFMALALSNYNIGKLKKALIMVGPGDTGKSLAKKIVLHIIGEENNTTIDLSGIEDRFGAVALYGKRLAGSNDMGYAKVKELKKFKQLVGGDYIYMERKGKDGFDAQFKGLLWFNCNELPKFDGDDGDWVYNRMAIIECKNIIPKHKQDFELLDKITKESEYIVNQLMSVLVDFLKNKNFNITNINNDLIRNYKKENNSVLKFIDECTMNREGVFNDNVTTSRFYDFYRFWCRDNYNGYIKTKGKFLEVLKSKNLHTKHKTCGHDYFDTITVNHETYNSYKEQVAYYAKKESNYFPNIYNKDE